MLKRLHRKSNQKGFTLIEILIVVVIVAILAAISVPIYLEYVESARASDAKTAISSIWQAAQIYYQDRGEYPATVEELEDSRSNVRLSVKGRQSCNGISRLLVIRRCRSQPSRPIRWPVEPAKKFAMISSVERWEGYGSARTGRRSKLKRRIDGQGR